MTPGACQQMSAELFHRSESDQATREIKWDTF
jgi:hypothetical protein